MNIGRKRKGRSDRVHVIYELHVGNKTYIGLTFLRDRSVTKTMRARIQQHWYNAHNRGHDWGLMRALKRLDCIEDVGYEIRGRVRGKKEAHKFERDLIKDELPSLNSDVR